MELVDVKAYLHFFMSRVYLCCSNSIKITVVMLQCVWSLTDEWINFLLVYETDLKDLV